MNSLKEKVSDIRGCYDSKGGCSLLQLTQKIDYGMFLLTLLVRIKKSQPLSLRIVANEHGMSFYFLQKAARQLRLAGLIEANRGKDGGYRLAKKPHKITLKDIVEALEGPIALMYCLNHPVGKKSCKRESYCQVRIGLQKINEQIVSMFNERTLSDFI